MTKKANAETIYRAYEKFVELDKESDKKKGEEGNELDHFWAAVLLEKFDKALTATARKEALRTMDVDSNGNLSLIEYCTWKYKKDIKDVEEASQGDDDQQQKLKEAQAQMDAVQKALDEVLSSIAALKAEREKLAVLKKELEAALAELKKQEEEYKNKCDALQAKIDNPSTSGMQRAKASNELAQLKAEDPLPLRRAKITAEAALRKVDKQEKAVARSLAEMEQKQADLEVKLDEARELLLKIQKTAGGSANGALWFQNRKLFAADYYLPTNKRKYNHNKTFDEQFSL